MPDSAPTPHGDAVVLRVIARTIRDATSAGTTELALTSSIENLAGELHLPRVDAWRIDGRTVTHIAHAPGIRDLDDALASNPPVGLAHIVEPLYLVRFDGDNSPVRPLLQLLAVHDGSGIGVYPLVDAGGRAIACITIVHRSGDEAVREGVALLVQQLASHIERMISQDSALASRRQLAAAQRLMRQLTSSTSVERLYEHLIDGSYRLFGCSRAALYLRGLGGASAQQPQLAESRGTMAPGSVEERLVAAAASDIAPRYDHDSVAQRTASPIMQRGNLAAVLFLERDRGGRDPISLQDEEALLEDVIEHTTLALTSITAVEELERNHRAMIVSLTSALEASDQYTLDHSNDVAALTLEVGRRLGMGERELRDLELGALLHDIGKLAIPSDILNKPGKLTDEEFEVMKSHTIIGERIIAPLDFLANVAPIVRHEHERWDGRGYPDGISGTDIPLASRIIFVCDAYDAITTDRSYRKARSHDVARAILEENAGSQFDPAVVQVFLEVVEAQIGARETLAAGGEHVQSADLGEDAAAA